MWSVGLIVGVAVVASVVLLIIGIVLTITIERRRYRKYIRRHTAGTVTIDDKESSPTHDTTGDITSCQSPDQPPPSNSFRAWFSPPYTVNPAKDTVGNSVPNHTPGSDLVRQVGLHKILRSSTTKGRSHRRRLQKRIKSGNCSTSCLSAITEITDHSQPSPAYQIPSAGLSLMILSKDRRERVHPRWPFQKREPQLSTVQMLPRTSLNCSSEFGDPLASGILEFNQDVGSTPSNPVDVVKESQVSVSDRDFIRAKQHRASMPTLDSVSNHVPKTTSLDRHDTLPVVGKPRSQALHDFDFDLTPTPKLKSPRLRTTPSRQGSRMAVARSMRASITTDPTSSLSTPLKGEAECRRSNKDLITRSAAMLSQNTSGRHSMIENIGLFPHQPKCAISRHEVGSDPFVTEACSRPVSSESRAPLQDLNRISSSKFASMHRKASAARMLRNHGSPLGAVAKLRNASMAYSYTARPGLDTDARRVRRHAMQDSSTVRDSPGSTNIDAVRMKHVRGEHNPNEGLSLDTPDSSKASGHYHWKFDFVLANSPKPSTSSSPLRSYNSPVLPSPAYTPANLCRRPQRTKVMGLRSPKRPPQSSLNPKSRLQQSASINGVAKNGILKRSGSTDLLRSIQILRSMNSEYQLPNLESGLGSCKVTNRNEVNSSVDVVQYGTKAFSLSRHNSIDPKQACFLGVNNSHATNNLLMSRPQSSFSIGGVSVWEDASVYEDSFKGGISRVTSWTNDAPLKANISAATNVNSKLTSNDLTCNASICDDENGVEPQRTVEEKIGLGLRYVEIAIPDTPQSLYDESGFLKV